LAQVYIPGLLRELTGGRETVEAEGSTVRQVVESLGRVYPGLAERLVEQGRLRPNISVAVDGEISSIGLLEEVAAGSEVHFITAIKGGRCARRS